MDSKVTTTPGRVTLADIAREVKMTPAAVSMALRDHPAIKSVTRRRIQQAARGMNYIPNRLAKSLSGGRTHMIGVLLTNVTNRYFETTLQEFQIAAERTSYALSVNFTHYEEERERDALQQFCESRVDGVLWAPGPVDRLSFQRHGEMVHSAGIPFVLLGLPGPSGRLACHRVGCSSDEALKMGVEYLLSNGHRRISVATAMRVVGMRGQLHTARFQCLRRIFRESGLSLLDTDVFDTSDNEYGGVAIAAQLAGRDHDQWPSAIFAADDMLSRGLVAGFEAMKIRVPDQISVLGFDNVAGDEEASVPITSVALNQRDMARKAIDLLLDLIEKRCPAKPYQEIRIKPTIAERASVRAVKKQ